MAEEKNEVMKPESEEDSVVLRTLCYIFSEAADNLGISVSVLLGIIEKGGDKSEKAKQKHLELVQARSCAVEDKLKEISDLLKVFSLFENQREDVFRLFVDVVIDMLDLVSVGPSVVAMESGYDKLRELSDSFMSRMPENPEVISQEEIDALLSAVDDEERNVLTEEDK